MAADLTSLLNVVAVIKVSSTLDKSVGKKNLTDGSVETCWTSQQGLPQFIQVTFDQTIILKKLSLVFQGGFVGTRCAIQIPTSEDSKSWKLWTSIYPEDVNRKQEFDLDTNSTEGNRAVRLVFEESSDFFGRITVYDLQLEGIIVG